MRLYPELVPTLVWTSLHVLMNMLFFLIVCYPLLTAETEFLLAKSTRDKRRIVLIQLDNTDI